VLIDPEAQALDSAFDRIRMHAAAELKAGRLDRARHDDVQQLLMGSTDFEALAYCDWVIDAGGQATPARRELPGRIESIVRPGALILAANCSAPAAQLFADLQRPQRAFAVHFAAPVLSHPAVQVDFRDGVDVELSDYLRWSFCLLGKVPLPEAVPFEDWCRDPAPLLDEVDGVHVVTVRRPQSPLSTATLGALHDVIEESAADTRIRGVILTGYGTRDFCAELDLVSLSPMLGDRGRAVAWAAEQGRLYRAVDNLAKPIVAALNGAAAGAGLELALRCHGIAATGNARMQFPEITSGIVPPFGATAVPYRRWPKASAALHAMLTRADVLGAERACELGIVDTLVDDHTNLVPAALWRINDLQGRPHRIRDGRVRIAPLVTEVNAPVSVDGRRLSPAVLEIMRRAIEGAARAATLEDALAIGCEAFADSLCTEAAVAGLRDRQSSAALQPIR
jgi:enoyl-CoA hydratase/carnithine racemase